MTKRIALIGDYNSSVTAHVAIPPALELAARALHVDVGPVWIPTPELKGVKEIRVLLGYQGIWCVPASPYANTEAISAISLARVEGIPFLGTCGGFQHQTGSPRGAPSHLEALVLSRGGHRHYPASAGVAGSRTLWGG